MVENVYNPIFRINYDGVCLKEESGPKKTEMTIHFPIYQREMVTAETPFPPRKVLNSRNTLHTGSTICGSTSSSRSGSPVSSSNYSNSVNIKGARIGHHIRAIVPVTWNHEFKCYVTSYQTPLHSFDDVETWLIKFLKRHVVKCTPSSFSQVVPPDLSRSRSYSMCKNNSDERSDGGDTQLSYEIVGLQVQAWKSPEQLKAFIKIFMPPDVPVHFVEALFKNVVQPPSHEQVNDRKRKFSALKAEKEDADRRNGRTVDENRLFAVIAKTSASDGEKADNLLSAMSVLLHCDGNGGTSDAAEDSPLIQAVKSGNHRMMQILLNNGANVYSRDSEAKTSFHFAAQNGDLKAIKLLWEAEAARTSPLVDPVDVFLQTPLMAAAEGRHLDIVQFFLGKGANPSFRDLENETALHRLVRGSEANTFSREVAKVLVQSGCPESAVNTRGFSASSLAAEKLVGYSIPPLDKFTRSVQVLPISCNMFFSTARQRTSQGAITMDISNVQRRPDFDYQFGLSIEAETESFIQIKPSLGWVLTNYCKCEGVCTLEKGCSCLKIPNKERNVFTFRGLLQADFPDAQPIVMCPAMCSCSESCPLKSLQNAVSPRMEIFQDADSSVWQVRTLDDLKAGQFVSYLGGEIIHPRFMNLDKPHRYLLFSRTLSVDISRRANCSRFFADSQLCPNLRIAVVREYDPLKPPQIAFFAREWVGKGEVLSYDKTGSFEIVQKALRDRAFNGYQFDTFP